MTVMPNARPKDVTHGSTLQVFTRSCTKAQIDKLWEPTKMAYRYACGAVGKALAAADRSRTVPDGPANKVKIHGPSNGKCTTAARPISVSPITRHTHADLGIDSTTPIASGGGGAEAAGTVAGEGYNDGDVMFQRGGKESAGSRESNLGPDSSNPV